MNVLEFPIWIVDEAESKSSDLQVLYIEPPQYGELQPMPVDSKEPADKTIVCFDI